MRDITLTDILELYAMLWRLRLAGWRFRFAIWRRTLNWPRSNGRAGQ